MIQKLWCEFNLQTTEHFYHGGGKIENRHSMVEALFFNFDLQQKVELEPVLFPVRFPSVLVNNNIGIAVSMASNICSFNLREICETTIALMKDPEHDVSSTLRGPDFPGGGFGQPACRSFSPTTTRTVWHG